MGIENQLTAIMHGDAYVDINSNSGKARLDIYHKSSNEDYLHFKKEVLRAVGIDSTVRVKIDKRKLVGGNTRTGNRLQSKFSSVIYDLNSLSSTLIAQRLIAPEALAILWQDDGTVSWHGKTFSTAVLCTDSWDEELLKQFQLAFYSRYGWGPSVMNTMCRGKQYTRLRFVREQAANLSEIIKDYIVPSMEYKLVNRSV